MAPAFGQRGREKESVDNYDVHVCLVKVCDNRVTKYVSIQTRERPGPARGKMVVRSQYVCLVKMCVTIASTKYVSFQTRARPGSARGKTCRTFSIRMPGKDVCDNRVHKVRLVPDKGETGAGQS